VLGHFKNNYPRQVYYYVSVMFVFVFECFVVVVTLFIFCVSLWFLFVVGLFSLSNMCAVFYFFLYFILFRFIFCHFFSSLLVSKRNKSMRMY